MHLLLYSVYDQTFLSTVCRVLSIYSNFSLHQRMRKLMFKAMPQCYDVGNQEVVLMIINFSIRFLAHQLMKLPLPPDPNENSL